ncbi:MAG: hypothetical protein PUG60_06635 [Lachnospiraceae bacterium]|nr:hypothetical protein [Lachnospiraceae bacterium]MDY4969473.1 hypothetical protein [Lachnospiraceae bacterium]
MRLRICICLFAVMSLIAAGSVFGYMSLKKEYADLNRQYEDSINQTASSLTGQEEYAEDREEETQKETQKAAGSDAFYYVTLSNDEIIAYTGDHRQVCMRTRIDEEELAEALIQELKQGIYLENLPALYEYLENCSS